MQPNTPQFDATPPSDNVRIADFSYAPPELSFTMDGEKYECFPIIPPENLQKIINALDTKALSEETRNITAILKGVADVVNLLLKPNSAARFNERLLGTTGEPLDLQRQVLPAMKWLVEQHTVRPTEQSSS